MSALRVCIIGLKCYDHIAAKPVPRYLGGIETQLTVLARGLAGEGCRVSLITYNHGQADGELFDSVHVVKSYQPERGVRIVRSIYPRLTALWSAMRRANADIYLQMGAGDETGRVALACRTMIPRRRFVFCLASDANYKEHLNGGLKGWEGKAYKFGLRYADLIVAQTDRQRDRAPSNCGIEFNSDAHGSRTCPAPRIRSRS